MSFEDLNEVLHEKIDAVVTKTYPKSKAEVVGYYQKEYPGKGTRGGFAWKQHLVADLSGQTGLSAKSLTRRFDPSRLSTPELRNASQYEALGKTLKPIKTPPPNGVTISFDGLILISDWSPAAFSIKVYPDKMVYEYYIPTRHGTRTKTYEQDASSFWNNPTIQAVFHTYFMGSSMVSDAVGDIDVQLN